VSSANLLGSGDAGGSAAAVAPKASMLSDAHHLAMVMPGGYKGLVLALLLILLRSAAMVTCVVVLTIAAFKLSDAMLPIATSLGQSFDRLGSVLWIGATTGVLLGALLTHRLGIGTFGLETRIGHALIAVLPALLMLVGLLRFVS